MRTFVDLLVNYLVIKFEGRVAMLPEVIEAIKESSESEWSQRFYLEVYDAYLNKISQPQA